MKGQIHHIELYVNDLAKSLKFWDWFLKYMGYAVYQEWDQGISYRLERTYLVFVQVSDQYKDFVYHRCHHGLNHLAFYAQTRNEVDTLTKALEEKGVTILYEDKHPYAGGPDYYAVFFEDPDRMKVEVVVEEDEIKP